MFRKVLVIALLTIVLITGCTDYRGAEPPAANPPAPTQPNNDPIGILEQGTEEKDRGAQSQQVTVTLDEVDTEEMEVFLRDNQTYVPLVPTLEFIGFKTRERNNGRTVQAGFIDVLYQIQKDSDQATVLEKSITLSSPVVTHQNNTYITAEALEELLGKEYEIDFNDGILNINTVQGESIFPGNEDLGDIEIIEDVDVPAVSRYQANRIIRTARKYVGTPYLFGSPSWETSRFDCSSFTQYVYGVNGIYLPRSSRAQAGVGRYVPVSQLRAGDLLFFYWPGRYSSNRVVGHVGIYMGNGYMISATPSNGVHIVNAAGSRYWRAVYLGAKRVS
jgi:hypothetical protein